VRAKRPRTERRARERKARALVREREKLAALSMGGARERPIEAESAAVIEPRVRAMPCPQCEGAFRIHDHASEGGGVRRIEVTCQQCTVRRSLWFRIVEPEPN
jgi:hypothetical protein